MKKKYKSILFEINYELNDILLLSPISGNGDFAGSDVYDDEDQRDWTGFH